MIELGKETERVLLVGVSVSAQDMTESLLNELGELAKTAGAEAAGRIIQNREQIYPASYV